MSLNALAVGTTTITATATGLATATTLVTVGLNVTLSPPSITVGAGSDGTLTLTLSGSAPSTINFALSSSNPSVATVPTAAPIPTGGNSISFKVTGVAAGSTVIKASAPGFPDVTSSVTVQPPGSVTLSVNSTSLQIAQVAPVTVTLSQPAPVSGVTVTLTNSDPTRATLSASSVFIPSGGTTATVQMTGVNLGSTTLGASTAGYTAATPVVIQVGTVIAWVLPSVTINGIGQQVLLDLRMFVTVPGNNNFSILDGLSITTTSSDPSVAVTPSHVNFFWDGSTVPTTRVQVTSMAPGTTILHASGTNIPDVTMTVIVNGPLAMTTSSLPAGVAGSPYSATVAAAGGTQPYHWSATGLPNGLNINSATGQITGNADRDGIELGSSDGQRHERSGADGVGDIYADGQCAGSRIDRGGGGSPQSAAINTAFGNTLKALVKDASNNPLGGVTVTFAAPGSGASGTFAGGQNDGGDGRNGRGDVGGIHGERRDGKLRGHGERRALSTSFALTNTAGSPASIAVVSGSPQSAVVNTAFANTLKVLVKDASNNPVSGATVTFAAPGSGASGAFAGGQNTAVTDGTGVATSAAFTANGAAGSYAVTASIGALSTNFALTNTAGSPASIAVAGGSPQSAVVNTGFANTLKVLVKDAGNNPVSGATVTFAAPGSGASGAFAGGQNTAVTDGTGVATSAAFFANGAAGSYVVTASIGSVFDHLLADEHGRQPGDDRDG